MRNRCLGKGEWSTNVDVHHLLEFPEINIRDRSSQSDGSTVNEDIEATKCCHGLLNGATDGLRIGTVRLHGKSAPAQRLNRSDHVSRTLGRALIGDGDVRAIFGQRQRDGSADASGTA